MCALHIAMLDPRARVCVHCYVTLPRARACVVCTLPCDRNPGLGYVPCYRI